MDALSSYLIIGLGIAAAAALFNRVRFLPDVRAPRDLHLPSISVVIPARNESENLGRLLVALRQQTVRPTEIIVVDDDSTDDTAQVAQAMGATMIVTAPAVPPEWTGKSWACWIGANHAQGSLLVFLDADVTPRASLLERLLMKSAAERALITICPFHQMEKDRERLAAFPNLVSAMGGGIARRSRKRMSFGPCMAIRRSDYFEIGGHEAIAGSVPENIALGALAHKSGLDVDSYAGAGAVSLRMYPEGVRNIANGFAKNLVTGTRYAGALVTLGVALWVIAGLLSGTFFISWLLGFSLGWLPVVLYIAFSLHTWWMLRQLGNFGLISAFLYPVLAAFFVAVFVSSVVFGVLIRRTWWKGRRVHLAPS